MSAKSDVRFIVLDAPIPFKHLAMFQIFKEHNSLEELELLLDMIFGIKTEYDFHKNLFLLELTKTIDVTPWVGKKKIILRESNVFLDRLYQDVTSLGLYCRDHDRIIFRKFHLEDPNNIILVR